MNCSVHVCCAAGALEAQVGSEEQLVQVMHTGLAARTVAGEGQWQQQWRQGWQLYNSHVQLMQHCRCHPVEPVSV
jgi:hypothetical protein